MQLLHSKLEQPRRPGTMHRERLAWLFECMNDQKLVTIIAGAGFGKTTLIIDVMERLDVIPAWYRLDEQDSDIHVFITYLYALLDRVEKTDVPSGKPHAAPKFGIQNHTEILIDWLSCVEKKVQKPTALIFDDYHLVQESDAVNRAIQFILERLPNHVHLIIMGRKELPLSLSGLRAKDQIIEISEKELCFSKPEIKTFFHGQSQVSSSDIDMIYETGRGWAAGLVLMRYAVKRNRSDNFSACIQRFQENPGHIFSYLKENIFDPQPEKIRAFMMKISLLNEIDARLCAHVFEIEDARQILTCMVDDHLFLFPDDDSGDKFHLHHLFRDFLTSQRTQNFSETQINRLHCRIAKALEPDNAVAAIDYYIHGKDFEQAVNLIKANEMQFMIGGDLNHLGRQIRRLPEHLLDKNPELLISLSRLYSHYGDPEKAIQLILNALKQFRQNRAKEEMVTCVVELASQYYYSGHLKEARLMMEQVLEDIPDTSQTYIIAMTYLTFLCSVLGDMNASYQHDHNARQAIAQYPELEKRIATILIDISLSHTLYFSGDFEQSQQLCRSLHERITAVNIPPCLPLNYYQFSANAYFLGEFNQGCTYAKKGIEICKKIQLADSRKAWVYIAWAQNLTGLGNFDEAMEKLSLATRLLEEPGNRWGLASAWDCEAQIYLKRNRPGKAKKILEKAFSVINGYGLTMTRAILENTYAGALLEEQRFQSAAQRLTACRPTLENAAYHLFTNHLLAARAHAGMHRVDKAIKSLHQAFDLAATHAYDRYVQQEKNWIVPLLETHFSGEIEFPAHLLKYAKSLFNPKFPAAPANKIKIRLFGKFALTIGDRRLTRTDFKSTKALILLKYLAAHRSRGYLHREILIEMLWPEQDPKKTRARFNMAMSALRKMLEPDLPSKAPSAYIDRKKDTYRLFGKETITIDTQTFSSLIARAKESGKNPEKALGLYLDAIRIHQGEFLEEDLFEQWCMELRESFLREYRAAIEAVICIYEQDKNWKQAIFYTGLLIKDNPLDESAVEKQMVFHSKTGRLSRLKTVYQDYLDAALKSDIPVSEKTKRLYHSLVKI